MFKSKQWFVRDVFYFSLFDAVIWGCCHDKIIAISNLQKCHKNIKITPVVCKRVSSQERLLARISACKRVSLQEIQFDLYFSSLIVAASESWWRPCFCSFWIFLHLLHLLHFCIYCIFYISSFQHHSTILPTRKKCTTHGPTEWQGHFLSCLSQLKSKRTRSKKDDLPK